jgi:hypothetical protein
MARDWQNVVNDWLMLFQVEKIHRVADGDEEVQPVRIVPFNA